MSYEPKVLPNLFYFGPTMIVLEITNVGTIAAKDIEFSYSLNDGKSRTFQHPLLRTNETKVIYLQQENGDLITDIGYFIKTETILKYTSRFRNVLKISKSGRKSTMEEISDEINLTKFIKQNESISVQYDEDFQRKLMRKVDDIARSFGSFEREFRRFHDEFQNLLILNRLTLQRQLLSNEIRNIIDSEKLSKLESKISSLFILLMDPYPDLRHKEIQQILNDIKELDSNAYLEVWKKFPSLKWAKVQQ
ncbi:MAG: hypothetical protein QXN55_02205 [Candidatus Nitrosotenuis sp.]